MRDLAWTVAGASAGSLARYWIDPIWSGTTRPAANSFLLPGLAAALVGFACVASIRKSLKTILIAAGGAAGSISIAAVRAASATPAQSIVGLGAFFGSAVVGLVLGVWLTYLAAYPQRRERC